MEPSLTLCRLELHWEPAQVVPSDCSHQGAEAGINAEMSMSTTGAALHEPNKCQALCDGLQAGAATALHGTGGHSR